MTVHRAPVRLALLGAGAIAQVVHLPILSRMRGVELAGVHDVDRTTAQSVAQRFGVERVARTADEILGDPSIQGIVVCTPSNLHLEHAREGLQAGKFVLCEKPLALDPAGIQALLGEDGADGRLMVAMNQRFRPDAAALRSFVAGGELGDVYYLKAGWLNRRTHRGARRTWRERRASGGGAFMDLGVQMLDLAMWLLGYPQPVTVSAYMHRDAASEVEDSAAMMLRLAGNRVVNLEVAWNLRAERDRQFLHLLGSSGSGSLAPLTVFKDLDSGLANVTPQLPASRENPYTASYREELRHFVEVVKGERKASAPVEQVQLMRLVQAAYRSAEEGKEIAV
jgi:predicted dehydrogenase